MDGILQLATIMQEFTMEHWKNMLIHSLKKQEVQNGESTR